MIIPEKEILKVSKILEKGGIIAFPTDTVWGIGCLIKNKQAVDKIYEIKSREKHKPLILLSDKLEYLLPYIEKLPENAKELTKKYFPGALTLVVKKSLNTPDYITSGYDTVGIRIPDHPVFIEMIKKCVDGHVLATTSANISGEGAFTNKNDVLNSLGDNIDYILDNFGYPAKGMESTVVSVGEDNKIKILRQGAIFLEG